MTTRMETPECSGWHRYKIVRPHSALGYRPPAPEAVALPHLALPPRLALELRGSLNELRGGPINEGRPSDAVPIVRGTIVQGVEGP